MPKDRNGFLDNILRKVTSRKLMVFAIATVALFLQVIGENNWMVLGSLYIGSEAALDLASIIARKGKAADLMDPDEEVDGEEG